MILFLTGWVGCALWSARLLGGRSPDLAIGGGFALWAGLIISSGLLLPPLGAFSQIAFIVLPLGIAASGFAVARSLPWRRWRLLILEESSADFSLPFALALGLFTVLAVVSIHLRYPVPNWDAISYHQPISLLFLQEGRFWQLPGMYGHINTFPKNGEITAAWLIPVSQWLPMLNLLALFAWAAAIAAGTYTLRRLNLCPRIAFLLMILSIAAPPVLLALTRHAGDCDLIQAALLLVALALILDIWMISKPPDVGRIATALIAICLCPGVKASGFILGGIAAIGLLGTIAIRKCGLKTIMATTAGGLALVLAFSSYWLFINYSRYDNPVHPVTMAFAGHTIFQGDYTLEEYIGTAEQLEGRTGLGALAKSLFATNVPAVIWGERIGGWGWHAAYLAIPIWLIALPVSMIRRRWRLSAAMLLVTSWLFAIPANWWARFDLVFFLMLPLSLAALWLSSEGRRGRIWNNTLLAVWILSALGTGVAAARDLWQFTIAQNMQQVANDRGRRYPVQQDALGQMPEHRRALYEWAIETIPPDATLTYDLGEGGDHLALMWRPEIDTIVRNLEWPDTLAPDTDYLLISRLELRQYLELSDSAGLPDGFDWAGRPWRQVYGDERFVAFVPTF
ncbi:hypothetical protein KQI84_07760 [bacterium]|nr:hypothetical protein [bacterium]